MGSSQNVNEFKSKSEEIERMYKEIKEIYEKQNSCATMASCKTYESSKIDDNSNLVGSINNNMGGSISFGVIGGDAPPPVSQNNSINHIVNLPKNKGENRISEIPEEITKKGEIDINIGGERIIDMEGNKPTRNIDMNTKFGEEEDQKSEPNKTKEKNIDEKEDKNNNNNLQQIGQMNSLDNKKIKTPTNIDPNSNNNSIAKNIDNNINKENNIESNYKNIVKGNVDQNEYYGNDKQDKKSTINDNDDNLSMSQSVLFADISNLNIQNTSDRSKLKEIIYEKIKQGYRPIFFQIDNLQKNAFYVNEKSNLNSVLKLYKLIHNISESGKEYTFFLGDRQLDPNTEIKDLKVGVFTEIVATS